VKLGNLLLPLLMAAALYWMFASSRRRQRDVQQVQSSVSAGAQVMTTAGLYATVVAVDGDKVTLETAPGQHSQWDKRAISKVLSAQAEQDDEFGEQDDEDEGDDDAAGTGSTAPQDRA
jgi:preprotein translocase subunit YajC